MKNLKYSVLAVLVSLVLGGNLLSGCNDDMPAESYFTFTGEMMSDYLNNHDDYSQFAAVVRKAGLMDLLSAFGTYTCFAPTNEAMNRYLSESGYGSVDNMPVSMCDTIARMHLMDKAYHTSEIQNVKSLPTFNMLRRFIQVKSVLVEVEGADPEDVIELNSGVHIINSLRNDSVQNGIMQPVDAVLMPSNEALPDVLEKNTSISLFNLALEVTGLKDEMYAYSDPEWAQKFETYENFRYQSDIHVHLTRVPETHNTCYTAFVVKDEVLKAKHGIETLDDLYEKAAEIYGEVYPAEVGQSYWQNTPEALKDRRNPLNRFMAYHLLDRLGLYDKLTTITTLDLTLVDPTEWYTTMCPHAMIKVQQVQMPQYIGSSVKGDVYINRCFDARGNAIEGAHVLPTVEDGVINQALNGVYYYIDDFIDYGKTTQEIVFNARMRMDLSTLFPELMSNEIRGNGDNYTENFDDMKYGSSYYFPDGYLKNAKLKGDGKFVYLRPRNYFWSYEGDECNLVGKTYDFEFVLPPVPTGDYEIRLGFCATPTRGITQVYFDGKPQGIPLDMRIMANDPSIGWKKFGLTTSEEAKEESKKAMKNKGFYRGPASVFNFTGSNHHDGEVTGAKEYFFHNFRTFRMVLCRVSNLDGNKEHKLRLRSVYSEGDAEVMIDYLEMVPKSVYGVETEGLKEDDN